MLQPFLKQSLAQSLMVSGTSAAVAVLMLMQMTASASEAESFLRGSPEELKKPTAPSSNVVHQQQGVLAPAVYGPQSNLHPQTGLPTGIHSGFSGNVPAGVTMGIPVGIPVAQPVGQPVGRVGSSLGSGGVGGSAGTLIDDGSGDEDDPEVPAGMSLFSAMNIVRTCSYYQGPVMRGGLTALWFTSAFRFQCRRDQPPGSRLAILYGDPEDWRLMFSSNAIIDGVAATDTFPVNALSYKYAAVSELSLKLAPILLDENFDEIEALGKQPITAVSLRASGRRPVLLSPRTYRCRAPVVSMSSPALSPMPPNSTLYYVPAYNLMTNPVLHTTYLSVATLASGKDEEAPHTDCMTPLRKDHPECMCLPVRVRRVWEKGVGAMLRARSVEYKGKQERKYLRFYARAGGDLEEAPKSAEHKPESKPAQPCVVGGKTYSTEAMHEAFLRVAWSAWLDCEPDAREWRLLAAVGRGDEGAAHATLADMKRWGDDAPTLARPRDGKTALHLVALHGLTATLAELFDTYYRRPAGLAPGVPVPEGATLDPTLADALGSTPLHDAILTGQTDAAVFLIMARAMAEPGLPRPSLRARDGAGNTPLHIAAQRGLLPVVKALVAAGASLGPLNNDRRTPLDAARANGRDDVVRFLAYFVQQQRAAATAAAAASGGSSAGSVGVGGAPIALADRVLDIIEHNPLRTPQDYVRAQLRARMLSPRMSAVRSLPAFAAMPEPETAAASAARAEAQPRFQRLAAALQESGTSAALLADDVFEAPPGTKA